MNLEAWVNYHSRLLFGIVLAIFTIQVFGMAFILDTGIIPDEGTHTRRIEYMMDRPLPMTPQPVETAGLGQISHFPFLYYYTLSKVATPIYAFTTSDAIEFFTLRFLNSTMAVLSLISAWWLINILTKSKLLALTTVIAYSQTTMVLFIGAGVNYDNAIALISFTACALTIELVNEWKLNRFLLLNVVLQAGALTKLSMLPLYAVCILVLVVVYYRSVIPKALELFKANRLILAIFFAFTLLTTFFYGRNIVQYHALNPTCDKVLTHESCLARSGIYARNTQLKIDDQGVREYNELSYFPDWVKWMGWSLYRFTGHRAPGEGVPREVGMAILGYMLFATTVAFIFGNGNRAYRVAAFIALFYAISLCYTFNYDVYQRYGVFNIAMQGRYLFPVLPLLYFFGGALIYWVVRRRGWLYLFIAAPILLLIINYGFAAATRYVDSSWMNDWAQPIIHSILGVVS